ncbi:phospho-sugar mutase [Streptobacillus moniliformis]|uniref:Phosphoglucomutase/phosphomannomutase alpha/beta/alpha domain I n=1 Tax=Streptobacillus moniliformis (strain ATCC 14647 / DSM 12112 / NCTC 10651 / 9901) TaxID=519441 RepID=D1AVR0_STRM9|nr:phospho-sugar mutase [Streptobacillus moniliformis]ACZ01820.1 phosphoglucomutase/phosphomannomutase alpha/beta/alpha domain I [Streptobacillus moniliformis DSM 12112]AVL43186.1 phospho-sugar mutase [Streptobacillus moniliformis]SQA12982.1 Phosphoglucomutase [Streptobacillus moniliformis]
MNYMDKYNKWLSNENLDADLRNQLESIAGNEKEIEDRFYQELEFGTAGLRGKLGAGTNRMNEYVIARATQALANVIKKEGQEAMDRGVAFAHDCRIFSPEFALLSALVMASNGIRAYLFESLRPTPELSYAIRYYKAISGVNITASHNPKDYNGYKVYWEEGSQIKSVISDAVFEEISKLDIFGKYVTLTKEEAIEKGLLVIIGEEIDEVFYNEVMNTSLRSNDELDMSIKLVYTPLNGAGNIPVRTVLSRKGYENVYVVKEQEMPDGTFPTLVYPNPEDLAAFEYSEKLAFEKNADILIATDPDCDRLAVEVMHNGKIVALNGNQTGVLLINYIVSTMKEKNIFPKNPVIVKSIVTGEMGTAVANKYGIEMINVLTGFKNICAIANMYEESKEKNYIFGYEESIGYNIGTFLRDKDGVSSALMLTEMAAYYKKHNKTLIDALTELFEEFGYYKEKGVSVVLDGMEGAKRIKRMMIKFREIFPKTIGDAKLEEITDYKAQTVFNVETGQINPCEIEPTDAVKFLYDDGSWYTLRPSGTEPKIKLYVYVKDAVEEKSLEKLAKFEKEVLDVLYSID